jgi:tetratricopeptide (TPR) repeat protein
LYNCRDEIETNELDFLLVSCYNNIAITCIRMKDYSTSMQACNYALVVNDKSDKSYYLRAKSRLAPVSSGSVEHEAALVDLKRALEINPLNTEAR